MINEIYYIGRDNGNGTANLYKVDKGIETFEKVIDWPPTEGTLPKASNDKTISSQSSTE